MIMKSMQSILLICFAALASLTMAAPASCSDAPRIARWYQNFESAVSLRFDDGLESHISTAIPLLNRHGFKATFMVNPGTTRYRDQQNFWERQVPAMGHRLGDHTMNHRGARDLEDADYEIGEAARTIWRAYPKDSKLLVFASGGGGKKWGGKEWEQADPAYRQLVEKYYLIDLYDGKHPSLVVQDKMRTDELCDHLDRTADAQSYQPFHFHNIGARSFVDYLKALVRGYDLTTSEETLSGFLQCLTERKHRLWVAPLIDILKYEEEARGATVQRLASTRKGYTVALSVRTAPDLYDHQLTMILPVQEGRSIMRVTQDNEEVRPYQRTAGEFLIDVKPRNSTIIVQFKRT